MSAEADRIALVVDGSDFFWLQKSKIEFWIDPKKLFTLIDTEFGEVVDAKYYIISERPQTDPNRFLNALTFMGYKVVRQEVHSFQEDRGNTPLAVSLDLLCNLKHYDTVVLVASHPHYAPLIERLQSLGKKVYLFTRSDVVPQRLARLLGHDVIDPRDYEESLEKAKHDDEEDNDQIIQEGLDAARNGDFGETPNFAEDSQEHDASTRS